MKAADHREVRARVLKRDADGAALVHWRELTTLGGRPCCARAVQIGREHYAYRPCVCAYLEHCPVHGLTHVGSHGD